AAAKVSGSAAPQVILRRAVLESFLVSVFARVYARFSRVLFLQVTLLSCVIFSLQSLPPGLAYWLFFVCATQQMPQVFRWVLLSLIAARCRQIHSQALTCGLASHLPMRQRCLPVTFSLPLLLLRLDSAIRSILL